MRDRADPAEAENQVPVSRAATVTNVILEWLQGASNSVWAWFGRVVDIALAPGHRLMRIIGNAEADARSSPPRRSGRFGIIGKCSTIWALRLAGTIVSWLMLGAYWLFLGLPFLFVWLFCVLVLPLAALHQGFEYTGWIGFGWAATVFAWLVLAEIRRKWARALSDLAFYVMLGMTPQIVFLCLHNGLPDIGLAPPAAVVAGLKAYEHAAVALRMAMDPVKEIAWWWLALLLLGLFLLSAALRIPNLLATGLRLQKTLDNCLLVIWITTALSFAATSPAPDYQPDIQARLRTDKDEIAKLETEISLAQELARFYTENPATPTILKDEASNLSDAMEQAEHGAHGQTRADLAAARVATIKALVPINLAATLTAGLSAPAANSPVPGSAEKLLDLDQEAQKAREELAVEAEHARAASVAVIAKLAQIPFKTVPLFDEIFGEIIEDAAEQLSERIMAHIPVERALSTARGLQTTVGQVVSANIRPIFVGLFGVETNLTRTLNGEDAGELRDYLAQETSKVTAARVQEERASESAREVHIP
jgi:hypothetical protein